jgi:ATP-dependent Clp protease adaptor protein ClpS
MLPPEFEREEGVATESETRVRKPPLFKVLLHNDDYTTMEFVIFILETVFNLSHEVAEQIMLHVHLRGVGVAGTYTFEVAEMKVAKVEALAEANEYPLLCTIEEA